MSMGIFGSDSSGIKEKPIFRKKKNIASNWGQLGTLKVRETGPNA